MSDQFFTLSNGLKLGYAEYGDPRGEVVFYFHGWPSSRLQGSLFDAPAKARRLRLICPDRPGIGLSDQQDGRTLHNWTDTLQELAAQVGADNWHVLAWSGGGPYALATALYLPKRTLSVNIVCGAPPLKFLGDREMFWIYRLMIQFRRFLPTVLKAVLKLGARIARGKPDRFPLTLLMKMLGEEDRRVLLQPGVFEVVSEATLGALDQPATNVIADADIYLNEWGFEVSQITQPVHFWHGKQDKNIAWTYTKRLASLIPSSTTHWSEIDGHYSLPITHAEAVLDQIRPISTGGGVMPTSEPDGLMTKLLKSIQR